MEANIKKIVMLLMLIVLVSGCVQVKDQSLQLKDQNLETKDQKPVERDFIEENTEIYNVLLDDGFNALVDTTEQSVLIRLELPEGYTSEASVLSILATVSAITKSKNIIVEIYKDKAKIEEVKTTTQEVLDVVADKVPVENFLNNLDWKRMY